MIHRLLHIVLMFFCSGWVAAQTPVFVPHPLKEFSNVRLKSVFQDSQGWLWFGAENGLYRYDGLTYQPYFLADSLADQSVSAIFENNGLIWVGYKTGTIGWVSVNNIVPQGATRKNPTNNRIQLWQPQEGTPTKPITAFAHDGAGDLWIATYGEGLYCLKNNRLYQFNTADDGMTGDEIYALATDHKGRIWAATDAGISICSMPTQGKKIVEKLTVADGLSDEITTALLSDAQGNIWIGTDEHGVSLYDVEHQTFRFSTSDWPWGAITSMALYEGVELWAGTGVEGILRIDLQNGTVLPLPEQHALRKSKIRHLIKDSEGLLWPITEKGMAFSANVRFSLLETPMQNGQTVLMDSQGRLWIGAKNGLFLQEKGRLNQIIGENVISICESANGEILVGSFGKGLFVLDSAGKLLKNITERDGLANGSILSIAATEQGIWLATLGGVMKLGANEMKAKQFQNYTHQNELGSSYVYKVLADRQNRVWFGTDGKGLVVWEKEQFKHFQEADGIALKTIYAIAEDKNGTIWFSTDKDGLFSFDGKVFKHFDKYNGLHSQNIAGIAANGKGQIIIAYTDGIDILTPETGHAFFFDAASGAPTVEPNLNALCTDRWGHVYVGCQQGVLRVTDHHERFNIDPQTRLRMVALYMEPIDFQTKTDFSHTQNYFTFDFTGLWYANPEAVRYRYKLEGFDHDWSEVKDHQASYPNLPPGQYLFRVQSSEHGRFEGTPEATYAFTIALPIWQRWWFIILALAAILGALRWYISKREQQLRREAALKKESVESQFETLKSQINPHFLFNSFNTLITIIEENPAVAVEYVEHLSDFYRTIMVYREKDRISLQEEMGLVSNFDFLLKKRYEDNYQLNTSVNGQSGFIMPLTLQMLVENAVKHNVISKSKPLIIDIFVENNEYIVVRNLIQKKIKPEPSTHFGLQSLIGRYRLMGEKQVIVNEQDGIFTVKVPILKNA